MGLFGILESESGALKKDNFHNYETPNLGDCDSKKVDLGFSKCNLKIDRVSNCPQKK